jgi:ribosomal protein L37AE/L43A
MTEKYIYCPACRTLEIHTRATGEMVGWLCQTCNPPLGDFS